MKENDYSKFRDINIYKDLPIKFLEYDIFMDILKFENTNTLEDLFLLYDSGYLNDFNKKGAKHLKSIIELLRFDYLDISLDISFDLNKKIEGNILDAKVMHTLINLGFTLSEYAMLFYYYDSNYLKLTKYKKNISILELLKVFYDDISYQLGKIIQSEENNNVLQNNLLLQNIKYKTLILIDALMKQEKENNKNEFNRELELLKDMKKFFEIRKDIDKQINLLNQQIKLYKDISHINSKTK